LQTRDSIYAVLRQSGSISGLFFLAQLVCLVLWTTTSRINAGYFDVAYRTSFYRPI